ncbi:hypothetical protein OSR40_012455 [Serratia rubidaea]|uniref:hypothetical protein n=1 Tax=Serratia rubidaea TaxID=61652 RepID=UPI0023B09918|nr:hypothetical protein [Serratia rubidaea]MDK1704547.1 hypothetical protein [Serratia rubidaea]
MSKREDLIDIKDVSTAQYGLVYSEILGWLDLGHAAGTDIRKVIEQMDVGERKPEPYYEVMYFQSMYKFGHSLGIGVHTRWRIKKGCDQASRHSIVLAMMMRTALRFENLQASLPFSWVTDSGFSAEDLVSDLLGFYRVIRPMNYFPLLRLISRQEALKRWDHYGPIGNYKNKLFRPMLFPDPVKNKSAKPKYGELPPFMKSIVPFSNFQGDTVKIVVDHGRHMNFGDLPQRIFR